MKQLLTSSLAVLGLLLVGCGPSDPTGATTSADATRLNIPAAVRGGVAHHVSVGGNDLCDALGASNGCDANFSLVANQKADGSVSGQWNDTFKGGGEGIHINVDCLNVVGNTAVVGGVIKHGTAFGNDVTGQRAVAAMVDNGTSSNDPPDLLSFSIFPIGAACTDLTAQDFANAGFLLPLATGQVVVN